MIGNRRIYMVLLSVSAPDKKQGQIPNHLEKLCSEPPKVLWIDSHNITLGCVSEKSAWHLYNHLCDGPAAGIHRIMVFELGDSWCAARDAPANGWFNNHLGQMSAR